jgi:hypothetical protein
MSKAHAIRVSLNKAITGKYSGDDWRWYNSQFFATDTTTHGLAAEIWRGYAFAPVYANNRRRKENFLQAWHIAFDFDTADYRSDLDALCSGDFFSEYGAFCYSTPSSKPEAPKSRMVYVFDEPVTDRLEYESFYRAMLRLYYHDADLSTKDAARLFFGSLKCDMRPHWRILPLTEVRAVISQYNLLLAQEEAAKPPKETIQVSPERGGRLFAKTLATMLNNLETAADGEKHRTLTRVSYALGGYVAAGYCTQLDAVGHIETAVKRMRNVRDPHAATATAAECIIAGMNKPIYIEVSRFTPQAEKKPA